jgi:hypothetical protein
MIELQDDTLIFSFPEVHAHAILRVDFQRTLRIPDDGCDYPLPPGLARFPLRLVDECHERLPERWREHGGVLLPMYQSEALWLHLHSPYGYPFALEVAAGKTNAVTGEPWDEALHRSPQDYLVVPGQPWLDGFCVARGVIRQFVAMPLGSGYSAEEQLTRASQHGGLQLLALPLLAAHYTPKPSTSEADCVEDTCLDFEFDAAPDMGLAPGGRMRQELFADPHPFEHWDTRRRSRCFVHLANALIWRALTGAPPPSTPTTAREYAAAGLPWFEWYGKDQPALEGAQALAGLQSVVVKGREKGDVPLPENTSVEPEPVIPVGPGRASRPIREGVF